MTFPGAQRLAPQEAFLPVLTQNGEVCSVDASGYAPRMRCLHVAIWIFCELQADGTRHDDRVGGRGQCTDTDPLKSVSVTDAAWLRAVDIHSRLYPH